MKCIIIDDDLFSTMIMADFVKRTQGLILSAQFSSASEAINYLANNSIDLIFLDIELPGMNGIDFMQSIDRTDKQVVIYSSNRQYALESYEYDVCDYLLKPVSYVRFAKAVNKVKAAFSKQGQLTIDLMPIDIETLSGEAKPTVRIHDTTGRNIDLPVCDIIYIEAQENYIVITTTSARHTVHATMKNFMTLVEGDMVVRTHRSYAIGVHYIKDFDGTNIELGYRDISKKIPLGKSYRSKVRATIKTLFHK